MHISICIPTYKRPAGLESLLSSISNLEFEKVREPDIGIIVVDNDANGSAREIVDKIQKSIKYPIQYEMEKNRGIPSVRNKLVRLAKDADIIAFVDDDGQVNSQWLDELLWVRDRYHADVVIGPTVPIYESSPPQWMIEGNFYGSSKFDTGEEVDSLRTNNVLINNRIIKKFAKAFEEKMSLTGGTDSLLGRKLRRMGIKFIWANEAIVKESIPETRMSISWLMKRRYRMGITDPLEYKYIGEKHIFLKCTRIAFWYVSIGIIKSMCFWQGKASMIKGMLYIVNGIGVIMGILGFGYEEYQYIHGK